MFITQWYTMVPEASKTTSFQAYFFYKTFNKSIHWYNHRLISKLSLGRCRKPKKVPTFKSVTVILINTLSHRYSSSPFCFLEYFPQTNVFAWICTIYASSIIGYRIQNLKVNILHYTIRNVVNISTTKLQWQQHSNKGKGSVAVLSSRHWVNATTSMYLSAIY